MGDSLRMGKKNPARYVTSHPGQLILAIPSWAGTMSTSNGFGHHYGRNSNFSSTAGPVASTAGILILTYSVNGSHC